MRASSVKEATTALGQRIHAVRRCRGFSQQQLADFAGVSKMLVSKWEHGQLRPQSYAMEKISEALCVEIDKWDYVGFAWDCLVTSLFPIAAPGSTAPLPPRPVAVPVARVAPAAKPSVFECRWCKRTGAVPSVMAPRMCTACFSGEE
jgi:DNA-binding XRE family transcriptional regulator